MQKALVSGCHADMVKIMYIENTVGKAMYDRCYVHNYDYHGHTVSW